MHTCWSERLHAGIIIFSKKIMLRELRLVILLLAVGHYAAGNDDLRCQEISDVFVGGFSGSGGNGDPSVGVVYRSFHINSEVVARYAVTTITSVVVNNDTLSRELAFLVQIPDTAFISNFTMFVDDKSYYGLATGKQEAAEEFEAYQQAGENVGLVEARGRNLFAVRLNSAPCSEVTFVLTYEELIVRRLSKFKHTLSLNPGSLVEDFHSRVRVVDEQGVTALRAPDYVRIERISDKEVVFSYSPSVDQQHDSKYGLARDMVVEYDVNHPATGAGLFVVNDCYFAQFFSPSDVEPVPVDLVFVIDVSGSMTGRKIEQTREALETIINQLRPEDRFTMVTFESRVQVWKSKPVSVSRYRSQAIRFAKELYARGGTDFDGGLQTGAEILKTYKDPHYVPLLVILTDGKPTSGVTRTELILENARGALADTRISLSCLGFGRDVNYDLLERLALSNSGIPRRIYEGSDAAFQLEGFFEEISTPILHDLSVKFPDGAVETISDTKLPILFDSNEFVVAGKFSCNGATPDDDDVIAVQVTGIGSSDPVTFESTVDTTVDTIIAGLKPSTERLTAYLLIQQLLEKGKITESVEEKEAIRRQALRLSLKYNFVTALTSLLVVESRDDGRGTEPPSDVASGDGSPTDDATAAPTAGPIATTFGRIPIGGVILHDDDPGFGSGAPSRGKRALGDADDLTLMDDEDFFHGGVDRGSGTTPPILVTEVVPRLVGGVSNCEGRLEMLVGGGPTWARAYDSYFGINEARVVCRQLGCPTDEPLMANASSFAAEPSVLFQTFTYCCSGEERNMTECQLLGSMCSNRDTIAITCGEGLSAGADGDESSALTCRSMASIVLVSMAILTRPLTLP